MAYSKLPWRPFLGHQAWSWTTLRRGNVFYYAYKRFLNCFVTFLRFLTFLFLFERFYIYDYCSIRPNLVLMRRWRWVSVEGWCGEEDGERWDNGEDGERTQTQPVDHHRRKAPVINLILTTFLWVSAPCLKLSPIVLSPRFVLPSCPQFFIRTDSSHLHPFPYPTFHIRSAPYFKPSLLCSCLRPH